MQQEPERPRSWLPDLDAIRDAWPEISAEVYERRRITHVMLSGAAVHHVDGHRVVLAHTSAPLAERLSDPRFSTPIVDAIQAVFGLDVEVTCVHVRRLEAPPTQPNSEQSWGG
ncbi:hypothetical protein ACPESR_05925 [Nocardia testacea]|uniref:hypothetical protein n=1 Tax=Nocardia testacea TaxID=248551 RepID=UPI003C2E8619